MKWPWCRHGDGCVTVRLLEGQGRCAARWVLQRESPRDGTLVGQPRRPPGPQASGLMNGISSKPAACSHVWMTDCEARGGFTWRQLFLRLSRPMASLMASRWLGGTGPRASLGHLVTTTLLPHSFLQRVLLHSGASGPTCVEGRGKRPWWASTWETCAQQMDGQMDRASVPRTGGLGIQGTGL